MDDPYEALTDRLTIHDATPGLEQRLRQGSITAYVGLDPTADSLHVGNLVPVMALAWLQRAGGTPIALIGAGTAMVGDPSGRRGERPVLAVDRIDTNAHAIEAQLRRFLRFQGANAARLLNNASWLRGLQLMEFLRDTGKHFTVNYMLQKESVRSRMDAGISFTEFSYMLVQAYDFWHLYREMGCELQMGGSDQWGNITAGIELIGRREGAEAHGLVFPLLTTAAGDKFGKSEEGNVWLDPVRTSPYRFYQFWLNSDDRDVERFLKLFTFLPLDRIAAAMTQQSTDPGKRPAQRLLAREVTATVHGESEADRAVQTSEALFGNAAGAGERLSPDALPEMPTKRISRAILAQPVPIVDLLVASGLASSKADARRGIQGKGFYLNGEAIQSPELQVNDSALQGPPDERFVILRKGKKNYLRLVFT